MKRLITFSAVMLLLFGSMGCVIGGYVGYPGKTTEGVFAKLTYEMSVSSANPLESGLWLYYVQYDNTKGQNVKEIRSYRDGTAPFGSFTTDGMLMQHFNDFVGTKVSAAVDTNGDGVIWFDDFSSLDMFCPPYGNGDPDLNDGFAAFCKKGNWLFSAATLYEEESKQSARGSKFGQHIGIIDPVFIQNVIASSEVADEAFIINITDMTVAGATQSLASPIMFTAYGFKALAIDLDQPGVTEACAWLADMLAGQPDGEVKVGVTFNGAAYKEFSILNGPAVQEKLMSR